MTDRQTDGRTRPFIVKDTEIWTRNIRNYLQVMLSDPHTHYAFFRLCGLWDASKDRRKRRVLAWKDQIGQRKDKPLPGGNCKDLNIYSRLYSRNFCRKISGTRRDCGGPRSPLGISGKNTEV